MWVGISRGRRVRDAGRRRDLGDPQQGRPRGLRSRNPYPEFGQCVHKLVHGRRRRRAPVPAEPLRRLPLDRRRRAVGGDHRRPAARVRVPDGRPPARPEDRLGHPAHRAPSRAATCPTASAAVWRTQRRRRHVERLGRRPAAGGRLRRRAARGDGASTGSTRSASTSGRAPASCTAAPTRAGRGGRSRTTCRRSGRVEAVVVD